MSKAEISKNENLIREAQLNSDWKALAELLSKQLSYVHSNGYIDCYESYLEKIQQGILRYQKIEVTPQTIQIFGELAIKTSLVKGIALVLGNPIELHNFTSTIWLKENSEWRLLLFQSTALK